MAANSYPAGCQAILVQYAPLAHSLATASGLTMDDLRQEIALAWLEGKDPARAVPGALGLRRLPRIVDGKKRNYWRSADLHVNARRAEETVDVFGEVGEMPRPKASRGAVAAAVAADLGLGLRVAQKRLKRQRDAAKRGQGDLFMDGGGS